MIIFFLFFFTGLIYTLPTKSLKDDILDVFSVFPLDEIQRLSHKHLKFDSQYKQFIFFLGSKEWNEEMEKLRKEKAGAEFFDYFSKIVGIDFNEAIKSLREFLTKPVIFPVEGSRNLAGFLNETRALIDLNAFFLKLQEKIYESKQFYTFFLQISSQETYEHLKNLRDSSNYQHLTNELLKYGINVKEIISTLKYHFAWED